MVLCDVCQKEIPDGHASKEIVWPIKGTTVLKLHVHPVCGHFLLNWVREVGIPAAAEQKKQWSTEHAEKRKPIGQTRAERAGKGE